MPNNNTEIDCRFFTTLDQLKEGFGRNNPSQSNESCTGCPNFKYQDGIITCRYLLDSMDPIE